MKKSAQLIDTLIHEYAKNKHKGYPSLVCRMKDTNNRESFSAHYAAGQIIIEAANPSAAVYGIRCLTLGVASGHHAEFLGDWNPRFLLRPLWIGCELNITLTSRIGVTLPAWLKIGSFPFDSFCRRLLELGYNSVLLGAFDGAFSPSSEDSFDLEAICQGFHEYGIKVILKPNIDLKNEVRCPLSPSYVSTVKESLWDLQKKVPSVDYIFCESCFQHPESLQHPLAQDATRIELVQAELKIYETALKRNTGLIFYIPATDESSAKQQATWLSSLSDSAGNKTILAFSALSGAPWEDHCSAHPFWEALRQSPDISSTPLMPIINIGSVKQGEGLWPAMTLDLIERYLARCKRHCFVGAICLARYLPCEGALLDCSLWTAGQVLWKEQPVHLLAESWFRAQRPDLNYSFFSDALKEIRSIVVELSFLRSLQNENHRDLITTEECRTLAASLLATLKQLQVKFEKEEKKRLKHADRPTFHEYFSCFVRDARRIVLHFLQRFNAPLLHYRDEDDQQEGFWTQAQGLTQSGRYTPKAIFLEHPQKGSPGSRMEMIFKENQGP